MKQEKRKDQRIAIQIWAQETFNNASYYHLLTNISTGGFFIDKKLPFPIGSIINLTIELPGSNDKLKLKGRIVNNYSDSSSNNIGAGVKFIDIDKKSRRIIEDFLSQVKVK